MQIDLIGEYEVTYQPNAEPALVLHHVVRGRDVATLDLATVAALRELLAVQQKRIRELPGGFRAIFGAGGDMALYTAAGQRVCYLNEDQAAKLARLLG